MGPGGAIDLDNLFTYHPPTGPEQIATFQKIRDTGKVLAVVVVDKCPPSRERSLAITKIQEAVMWANASIAVNPVDAGETMTS